MYTYTGIVTAPTGDEENLAFVFQLAVLLTLYGYS